jgi:hypothetical protein|tara:strand:+ start:2037 stop:2495 length:459 start_codon:yes stop_codon:yes gene_type:complete
MPQRGVQTISATRTGDATILGIICDFFSFATNCQRHGFNLMSNCAIPEKIHLEAIMSITKILFIAALAVSAQSAMAQDNVVITPSQDNVGATPSVNCEDPANAANQACLGLPNPNQPITNFLPIAGPILGAGVLAGLGGGSTPSTTSTTSTN